MKQAALSSPGIAARRETFQSTTVALALGMLAAAPAVLAHPVSLSWAELDVRDDKIKVTLEHLVEDFLFYQDLELVEDKPVAFDTVAEKAEEHRTFLQRYFALRDRDGDRFALEAVSIDLSDIPEDGVPQPDLMNHAVVYEFAASFDPADPPEFLSVYQNFGGKDPAVPAETTVRLFHRGVNMHKRIGLAHGTLHVYELDWDLDFEALKAAQEENQERSLLEELRGEDDLGITSYAWVYNYIYIEEDEVRHELLVPFLTLETWFPIERESEGVLTVEEQRQIEADLIPFLREHNQVIINGEPVELELDRLEFFGPEHRDFAQEAPERGVSAYSARAGIIASFPSSELPARVEFEWGFFNKHMDHLTPRIYAYDGEVRRGFFDYFDRRFVWEHPETPELARLDDIPAPEPPSTLQLPVLSLAGGGAALLFALKGLRSSPSRRRLTCALLAAGFAAGSIAVLPYARAEVPHPFQSYPEIDDDRASAVFEKLHRNIYRAFEYRDEDRIYEALDRSVAGPLLEQLYLRIRENLTLEEQGGAVSRIEEIEILDGGREPSASSSNAYQSFDYRCVWTVTGTVEHWGHIHTRKNQYEALFTVEGLSSGWKITAFDPLREEQVDRRIRLRQ